jgi:hypothetical protein
VNQKDKAREVEARLHRSLVNQVRVPPLDRRFDAAVWARIDAQEQAQTIAAQPGLHRTNSERWLQVSNIVGIAVAAVLVLYFGLRLFGGVELEYTLQDISAGQAANVIAWAVTITSVGFAALFSPLGRRLRSEFI